MRRRRKKDNSIPPVNAALLFFSKHDSAVTLAPASGRLSAFFLDLIISFPLLYLTAVVFYRYVLYELKLDSSLAWYDSLSIIFASDVFKLLAFLTSLLTSFGIYRFLSSAVLKATPGMKIVGIRYISSSGTSPSVPKLLIREILAMFSFLFLLAGYVWSVFDDAKRSWHDKFSGIFMVKDE